MTLITPEKSDSRLERQIQRIEATLDSFLADIEDLQKMVRAGEVTNVNVARKLFSDLRTWLKLAHETEAISAQRSKTTQGIVHNYGLDLDEARTQIGCRLARLRRCCQERDLPE